MITSNRVRLIRYIEVPRVRRRRAWSKNGRPFIKVPIFQVRFPLYRTLPRLFEDRLHDLERQMAGLINRCRADHPIESNYAAPLRYNYVLAEVARLHSRDMRDKRYIGHRDSDGRTLVYRLLAAGISFGVCGENIAGGPTEGQRTGFRSIEEAHWGLFNEPRYQDNHRRNLLSGDFRQVGIGIVQNDNGTLIITQVFID